MKKLIRILLPLIVIFTCLGLTRWMVKNKKEPERFAHPISPVVVEVVRLQKESYQVILESRGVVRPHTESTLIPEVSGRIVDVSPNFREGGFFEKGEVLVTIDDRDYQGAITMAESALLSSRLDLEQERLRVKNYETDLSLAQSDLARAQQNLAEETARANQAREDWERMNPKKQPDDLVVRKPQLAAAASSLKSIESRIEQIQRNIELGPQEILAAEGVVRATEAELTDRTRALERTKIVVPYEGRILEKMVDIGQYVAPGNVLASLFAVDYVEIRLPLTNRQLGFIQLPEKYKEGDNPTKGNQPEVVIKTKTGGQIYEWNGSIVRSEGAIDSQSRQLFVVAQVHDPYGSQNKGRPPLKIGQFVEAELHGVTLEDVFVLPRSAVRENRFVLMVDENNKIRREEISILWADSGNIVIRDPEKEGHILCKTPLLFAVNGTEVRPIMEGEDSESGIGRANRKKTGKHSSKTGDQP